MFNWVRTNVIAVIVGTAVLVGAGLTAAALSADQSLLAVLTGLTLVASVAIFAAAVAAAIYAKPAYDDAVSLRRPAELNVEDFCLQDGTTELAPDDRGTKTPVYSVGGPRPSAVKLRVTITNEAQWNARCIFNIQVPTQCELAPLDAPRLEHYLTGGENLKEVMPGVIVRCRSSAAEGLIPSGVTITYTATITLPDADPDWEFGWPMRVAMRGVGNERLAIDFAWWLS